jgi:hypothetical protein
MRLNFLVETFTGQSTDIHHNNKIYNNGKKSLTTLTHVAVPGLVGDSETKNVVLINYSEHMIIGI